MNDHMCHPRYRKRRTRCGGMRDLSYSQVLLRSTTRKRKDKGKPETVNVQPPPQQDEGVASQRREEPVVAVVPIEEPFVVTTAMSVEGDIAASLTDEQLYRVVARPATPEENENGWTTVAAQQKLSSASSTGSTASQSRASPNADEDIVDVLSQSVSIEFLNQQTQAPSDGPSYLASELEGKEANITSLIIEKQELESRLGAMFDELANLNRRNQELDDENRRQAQAIQLAEGTVRVLKGEMAEAKRGEEMIRREVENGLQRIRSLEEEQYGVSEALKETESTLQRERRNREGAQLELEESAKRNKDLEERTRRLLEEHQRWQIWRGRRKTATRSMGDYGEVRRDAKDYRSRTNV
ncbi:hypothetical protein FPV67DRAFT_512101 [Lyophyllum atratum]|nr:hypothetical protein FPV67DRAFT_512101 [Lyophyllum atratum]